MDSSHPLPTHPSSLESMAISPAPPSAGESRDLSAESDRS